MNYEQKYKEALERARKIENGEPLGVPDGTSIPVAIFPELKESEDEIVIRDIKVVLECSATKFFKEEGKMPIWYDRAIAWLEKQGEQKPVDKSASVFTIQDAKDGDVLCSPSHHLIWIYKGSKQYYACVNMTYATENIYTNGSMVIPKDVYPATKDEQTILFERMKEAGYEWDADKKELINKLENRL